MRIEDFDNMVRGILAIEQLEEIDKALNGLQVTRQDPLLKSIAFAVDASLESFKRAHEWGADLLFAHHGLFFGKTRPVTLDMHPRLGNNAALAGLLDLKERSAFGSYRGVKIGVRGTLPAESSLAQVTDMLGKNSLIPPRCLAFGSPSIKTVGIVSGGSASNVREAIDEKLDLFITGDASHDVYHECAEAGINVIFAGHYLSEVWGVRALEKVIAGQTDLRTCFIDVPTGF
jgi:putative NIF3 family GTP cyclohydrolase 1 type 2